MTVAEEAGMPCGYCESYGHEASVCPREKSDRRFERGMGCFFVVLLVPFFAVGFCLGILYDALSSGFQQGLHFWAQSWKKVRPGE